MSRPTVQEIAQELAGEPLDPLSVPVDVEAVKREICAQVAAGASLVAICARPGMPDHTTVYGWLREDELFARLYYAARVDRADALVDEILAIVDDATIERPERAFRIKQRRWLAARLKPAVYDPAVRARLDEWDKPRDLEPRPALVVNIVHPGGAGPAARSGEREPIEGQARRLTVNGHSGNGNGDGNGNSDD